MSTEYKGLIGLSKTGQSPIDIDDSIVREKKFPPFYLNGHWLNEGEAILSNDGKTAKVILTGKRIPSYITGGPAMQDMYEFYETHFHWGEEDCRCEGHTINGTWFSLEAHAVHWNRKYQTFEESLNHPDGLCTLAYLFLVRSGYCAWSNPQLERITENLKYIINPGSETKIPSNALAWMRDATSCSRYYTYSGSFNKFNKPECNIWIVFPIMIPITSSQLDQFRKLRNEEGECIKSNGRKIQLLKGRRIFLAV